MTADSLRERSALVTGGSRGIGAAISKALAEAGAAVAINYRERADEANKLAEHLRKPGLHVTTVQADASLADAVSGRHRQIRTRHAAWPDARSAPASNLRGWRPSSRCSPSR
jgi:3-oxoacyl-[acyl-carrier protein] reductase